MIPFLFRCAILLATILVPASAWAAEKKLVLSSDIFVERQRVDRDGRLRQVLERPATIVPGDTLLFIVNYRNAGDRPASDLILTNPLPRTVAFDGVVADGAARMSVDGGRNWGVLTDLRVPLARGGSRPASTADVTHIQWKINKVLGVGASGKVMFRGVVR